MEPTQFQTNNKPLDTPLQTANVVRKAHLVSASSNSSTSTAPTTNANPASVASTAQSNTSGIAGGGGGTSEAALSARPTALNVTSNNIIQQANNSIAVNVSNGQQPSATSLTTSNTHQAPAAQQIIQVSSQGSAIMPGQLMVQTLSAGRPTIQLRAAQTGQQFQQIQLIPFSNLQGQSQRPVIIQQSPGNVIHPASATAITSMGSLSHNVAKITSVGAANSLPNSTVAHQRPLHIIQQSSAGQFLHSTSAQPHNLHGHNVTKIATVGRAPARTPTTGVSQTAVSSKMVLGNHTGQVSQQNHLTNNTANPQQVTRLNIISQLPGSVHTSVSSVQSHGTAGKPILSLATTTLNKPLIINPATSVVQPASIVGNVVNMNNATAHQLKQPNAATNIIPTVMTLTTLTTSSGSIPGRHTMITTSTSHPTQPYPQPTSAGAAQRLTVQPSLSNSTPTSGSVINSSANLTNSNLPSQPPNSASISSTLPQNATAINQQLPSSAMRSNLLTSSSTSNTLNSPIKQPPQGTPSSPRPSILIR